MKYTSVCLESFYNDPMDPKAWTSQKNVKPSVSVAIDCFQFFGGKDCLQWEKRKDFQILNPNVEL